MRRIAKAATGQAAEAAARVEAAQTPAAAAAEDAEVRAARAEARAATLAARAAAAEAAKLGVPQKRRSTSGCTTSRTSARLVAAAEPIFTVGSRVRKPFPDGFSYPGCVESTSNDGGAPTYCVQYDDGDYEEHVPQGALRLDRSNEVEEGEPPTAISPDQAQIAAAHTKLQASPPLPAHTIHASMAPGGASHCGGDLIFPNLTCASGLMGSASVAGATYKMPKFVMGPGAAAAFSGALQCHGTGPHHEEDERQAGCEAHVSFAVQTPALTLGFEKGSEERGKLHKRLAALGALDAQSDDWADAVWIPVWRYPTVDSPVGYLEDSEEDMVVLMWSKIVLYDVETDEPLVFYDLYGGLLDGQDESQYKTSTAVCSDGSHAEAPPSFEAAPFARRHFGFLHDEYRFGLNRHASGSTCSGCLHLDPMGDQRMEVWGVGVGVGAG